MKILKNQVIKPFILTFTAAVFLFAIQAFYEPERLFIKALILLPAILVINIISMFIQGTGKEHKA